MRALSKSSSETQTLKISIYPKNIVLREIFSLAVVFFYQITVHNELWGYMEILSISLWFSYH